MLVHALRSEVDLQIAHTRRRGHAATLAREARADGVDAVVVLGGDGTVNEAVNGLLADGTGPDVPAFAVVPGGSTNVFARALGLPKDWVEATGVLLEALRLGRYRTIGLGRADERYFTFCAGLGMDADVVRRVERARLRGQTSTPLLYMRAAVTQYLTGTRHREAPITLEQYGAQPEAGLANAIIQNTSPWTYLGDRPVDACPGASFDLGLDLMALRELRLTSTSRTAMQLLLGGGKDEGPHGKRVFRLHDVDAFTLRCSEPLSFQLDGDFLGQRDKIRFTSAPAALQVIC